MALGNKPFHDTVGNGEIAPFPTVFSTCLDNFLTFSSANSFSLEESKICCLVNVLNISINLSKTKILDSSKLRAFADDNFKFDKNGRKFSKGVEKTVGKGETAH